MGISFFEAKVKYEMHLLFFLFNRFFFICFLFLPITSMFLSYVHIFFMIKHTYSIVIDIPYRVQRPYSL